MIASGKAVTLTKGEILEGIELELTLGGVITGRVTTAGGWPVIGQRIYPKMTGLRDQRQLPASTDADTSFKTDDRGIYRVYGLPTGRYIVSIQVQGQGSITRTFHPSATDESRAEAVEVTAGKVTENVDIKLFLIGRAYEVSGRVVDKASGQPIPKISVGRNMLGSDGKSVYEVPSAASANENGEFNFTNLLPGRYVAYVSMANSSEYYSDKISFEVVDQDVAGVEIKVRRAGSLSGKIVVEGTRDPAILADLSYLSVLVFRLGGGAGTSAQAAPDGRFRISGLPPDKYRLQPSSSIQRRNFSLLGVEREGVRQSEGIEVAAGEQISGLRVIVSYGEGVVQGQVQVVGGALPEGARLSAYARRVDVPSNSISSQSSSVDARGMFVIVGLATGVYEINLSVSAPTPPGSASPFRPWALVRQTVSVAGGVESQVKMILDISAQNTKGQKR
jgi:hypothetical protein